ncbi:MAG: hypothetical protein IPQ07_32700 [Myxococcales bacterium]|nr:hypothetical protein [Myxococcales bacterium]
MKPPVTSVPEGASDAPLGKVDLDCTLTKRDEMCVHATPRSLSITVNKIKDCIVSGSSNELTMAFESTASPKDGISVQLSNLHLATGLDGSYTTTANQVVLNDGGNDSAANGVSPHTGFTCQAACTVGVVETRPAGVRRLELDVRCPEVCIPNACLRCLGKGTPDVHFKVAAACP